jgi:hypothetical protein
MEAQEERRNRVRTNQLGIVPLAFPTWTNLGPNPIPNGQTLPVNPVSGRVSAIEVDPTDPNKVYAGAAQGGVYRSLDGGATWAPLMDNALSLAIGALALDTTRGCLYVGTGESSAAIDSFGGVGIYRIDNVNTNPVLVGPINPIRNYNDGNNTPTSLPVFNGSGISKILSSTTRRCSFPFSTPPWQRRLPFGDHPPHAISGLYHLTGVTAIRRSAAKITVTTWGLVSTRLHRQPDIDDIVFDPGDATGNTCLPGNLDAWGAAEGRSLVNKRWRQRQLHPNFLDHCRLDANGRGVRVYSEEANPTVVTCERQARRNHLR